MSNTCFKTERQTRVLRVYVELLFYEWMSNTWCSTECRIPVYEWMSNICCTSECRTRVVRVSVEHILYEWMSNTCSMREREHIMFDWYLIIRKCGRLRFVFLDVWHYVIYTVRVFLPKCPLETVRSRFRADELQIVRRETEDTFVVSPH